MKIIFGMIKERTEALPPICQHALQETQFSPGNLGVSLASFPSPLPLSIPLSPHTQCFPFSPFPSLLAFSFPVLSSSLLPSFVCSLSLQSKFLFCPSLFSFVNPFLFTFHALPLYAFLVFFFPLFIFFSHLPFPFLCLSFHLLPFLHYLPSYLSPPSIPLSFSFLPSTSFPFSLHPFRFFLPSSPLSFSPYPSSRHSVKREG